MSTIREVQALLLLYAAAPEPARARARELVPDLVDLDLGEAAAPADPNGARRWRLRVTSGGMPVDVFEVVCREEDLEAHREALRAQLPLAVNLLVVAEAIDG